MKAPKVAIAESSVPILGAKWRILCFDFISPVGPNGGKM
jgi:hypothetical protein